ncbi:MAG: hypothetical protein M1826_002331 [Phylliscum demangeonii]|nr:MAG: hypothetical protein M1826_002331 [Phylliscum demangeonii]
MFADPHTFRSIGISSLDQLIAVVHPDERGVLQQALQRLQLVCLNSAKLEILHPGLEDWRLVLQAYLSFVSHGKGADSPGRSYEAPECSERADEVLEYIALFEHISGA